MRRLSISFSLVAALAAATFAPAQQGGTRVQDIRAGILILDSAKAGPGSPTRSVAPHAWFNLDRHLEVKPAGWNFMNPRASSTLTPQAHARWTLINGTLGLPAPAAFERLTKRHAAYWEVILSDTTDATLADYDVLLANPFQFASLNPLERERLRRFVDQGGVLWIDPAGLASGIDAINNFPLAFGLGAAGGGGDLINAQHPLMSRPQWINRRDITLLNGGPGYTMRPLNFTGDPLLPLYSTVPAEFFQYQPVMGNAAGITASVGRIGDGFVVVTARGASVLLNRVRGSGAAGNQGFVAMEPVFEADSVSAAKLAVNIVSLASEYREAGGGSRKQNSLAVDVGAPLLRRFRSPEPAPAPNTAPLPVIYKGLVIVALPDRIRVYDAEPNRDLDGDGDPDDGVPDYALGSGRDLLWESLPMVAPISSPAAVEVPEASGVPRDQILVVDGTGTVRGFDAFQRDAGGFISKSPAPRMPAYTVVPPGGPAVFVDLPGRGPFAPTLHEGLAYVADTATGGNHGRLWVVDIRQGVAMTSGAVPWSVGGAAVPPNQLPHLSASPTVGYIPILDHSGGLDRVLYAPFRAPMAGVGPQVAPGLASYWLGARGERPSRYRVNGGVLEIETRAFAQGNLPIYNPPPAAIASGAGSMQGIKVTLLRANGDPADQAAMAAVFAAPPSTNLGMISIPLRPGVTQETFDDAYSGIRVDYTIDWGAGTPGLAQALERGRLTFPARPGDGKRVLGQIALTPRGTMALTVGNGAEGGSFFSIREEGRGQFRVLNRWDLYDAHEIMLNQRPSYNHPAVVRDLDPLAQAIPPLGGNLRNLSFRGGPTVRNNVAYVTAGGMKLFQAAALFAFDVEPEAREVVVGDLGQNFSILQPDLARSTNPSRPELFSIMQGSGVGFSYDREEGKIRFESLMMGRNGAMVNSLSTSQPIIIRRPGQPDDLRFPDAAAGRWSPLLWYVVFQATEDVSAPIVTGNTVFLGGGSRAAAFLGAGGGERGTLVGMDAEIPPNDDFLMSDPARPWLRQVAKLKTSPFRANERIRWPQVTGITNLSEYATRLLQASLEGSTNVLGIVAGDRSLVALGGGGMTGIHAFSRADFLVADEGRLARFDPSGNLLWSSRATAGSHLGSGGNVQNVIPLVRPTKAYRIGENEMLVVDTGGNRIMRSDLTGVESRSIREFQLDPNIRPEGFRTGAPLTLNAPRDAITYFSYQPASAIAGQLTPGEPAGAWEYWVHYLIADSGNQRLVELVDRYQYDSASGRIGAAVTINQVPQTGVLLWHTPAHVSGKDFAYNSIGRVWLQNPGRYVYVAGIGGQLPSRTDVGLDSPAIPTDPTAEPIYRESRGGTGGVVIFDPTTSQGVEVINRIRIPAIGQSNVFWNEGSQSFQSAPAASYMKLLGNLQSVTATAATGGAGIALMITDDSGVYEVVQDGTDWRANWMLPNSVYRVMRRPVNGAPFATNPWNLRALYARRLDSGEVLVVNGYVGRTRGGQEFLGEILQVDGRWDPARLDQVNFGFDLTSILYELRTRDDTRDTSRGIVLPVFADRQ
jgi:hypothetical protein